MFVLRNALIHTENGPLTHHSLLIEQGRIEALLPDAELPVGLPSQDLRGQHLSAGFIDLQINGCGGVMFNAAPAPKPSPSCTRAISDPAPPVFCPP